MGTPPRKKWLLALFATLFISLLLIISIITTLTTSSYFAVCGGTSSVVSAPPSFGYYIYGGAGDKEQIVRLLLAVYHPRNRYLVHLTADASDEEREWVLKTVMAVPAVAEFGNVDVVGRPMWLTSMGSSYVAAVLRAAAILLRLGGDWDWFISLHAHDYPLLTQDDLSYVFSSLKRDFNFIDHTSDLGWKEQARIQPIVVDPAIYLARRCSLFKATQKRPTPLAFKVFTGSPWFILSRSFIEFCVLGWDNLPRTILMYFNNAMAAQEGYFHSVICNSPEFSNTTVNTDLRFMVWDKPAKMDAHFLEVSDFDQMIQSGFAFARRFKKDDPVLNMIDVKILRRGKGRVSHGAWCGGHAILSIDPCAQFGDVSSIKPGPQAIVFSESIRKYVNDSGSRSNRCQ